jgi:hypothetical protein
MTQRRALLACLPVTLAPAGARAFRLEPASPDLAAEYGARCGGEALHDALRAEVERLLDGRPLPASLAPRLAELTRCPSCGCLVTGAAPMERDPPA